MGLTHISLFSGIGGMDIAAGWAGFKTVLFCEIDPFCQAVLKRHWPGVPIIGDIHDVTGVAGKDTQTRSQTRFQSETEDPKSPITIISGGFPCQPFSVAGKRKGEGDDRYLWPEMLRVIQEIWPTWVIGENVAGIVSMALGTMLSDLEGEGYEAQSFLIPACGVGARHRRNRVFVVAHAGSLKSGGISNIRRQETVAARSNRQATPDALNIQRQSGGTRQRERELANKNETGASVNPSIEGLPDWAGGEMGQPAPLTEFERPGGREIERNFCGVVNGISRRVDRLKALGNAVVPQQVYPIFKAIADIENSPPKAD